MILIYARHGQIKTEHHNTFQAALSALQWGNDSGEMFALGIVDDENKVIYLPDCAPAGKRSEDFLERIMKAAGVSGEYKTETVRSFPDD